MNGQPAVLYVEDDLQSRKLMKRLLQGRMGLENVTILENSESLLECVECLDPKPQIIFLDIHVLPHNGFKMLQMLRTMRCLDDTPIVALTASVMNEEVQMLRTAGFDGCLAKPIDLPKFPEMFERIIEGEALWRITH